MSAHEPVPGKLYLMPNTLDFGMSGPEVDLQLVIPRGVIEIAARLGFWAAENAKTTRSFLKRVHAVVPLQRPLQEVQIVELPRANKGNKSARAPNASELLAPALNGNDMGLISEAGLPAIADPGATLVAAAHAAGIRVEPLSGPSSLLLALSASGLNGQSFAFVGYLPVEAADRDKRIRHLEALSRQAGQTQLVIETPYRNQALMTALLAQLAPTTQLSVSCGLTTASGWSRTMGVATWRAAGAHPKLPNDTPAVFLLLA